MENLKGKIIIVDWKKAKVVEQHGNLLYYAVQQNGKYKKEKNKSRTSKNLPHTYKDEVVILWERKGKEQQRKKKNNLKNKLLLEHPELQKLEKNIAKARKWWQMKYYYLAKAGDGIKGLKKEWVDVSRWENEIDTLKKEFLSKEEKSYANEIKKILNK